MEIGYYTIIYHEKVAGDIKDLSQKEREQIKRAIQNKLATKPLLFGEPLRSTMAGYRKLRVGNYRIVYKVLEKKNTLIIIIAHRRHVYAYANKRT